MTWLDCTCEVCQRLDALAYDKAAWYALLEQEGMWCPVLYPSSDERRLTIGEVIDGL